MKIENDGGPAFPTTKEVRIEDRTYFIPQGGMSLREWFAGMALQGICASSCENWDATRVPTETAALSYRLADAVLAELAKEEVK